MEIHRFVALTVKYRLIESENIYQSRPGKKYPK